MRGAMVALGAFLGAAGCRSHVTSCDDPLLGVWQAPNGERWFVLDNRAALEAYPMFDDAVPPPGVGSDVVLAPRAIDLARRGDGLAGRITRRAMRRGDACELHGQLVITSCTGDALELQLVDPPPPTRFAPCGPPPAVPPRAERWQRPT